MARIISFSPAFFRLEQLALWLAYLRWKIVECEKSVLLRNDDVYFSLHVVPMDLRPAMSEREKCSSFWQRFNKESSETTSRLVGQEVSFATIPSQRCWQSKRWRMSQECILLWWQTRKMKTPMNFICMNILVDHHFSSNKRRKVKNHMKKKAHYKYQRLGYTQRYTSKASPFFEMISSFSSSDTKSVSNVQRMNFNIDGILLFSCSFFLFFFYLCSAKSF